jgi:uncharacterized protein YegL
MKKMISLFIILALALPIFAQDSPKDSCPSPPADMCVIIDTSKSVKKFQLDELKEALADFAGQLDVGPGNNQVLVAAVTFGGIVENPFSFFDHTTTSSLVEAMRNISRVAIPKHTRTDLALQECVRLFDDDGREEAHPVIVVFTDGKVFPKSVKLGPTISQVRASNATVVAVGIGSGIDKAELLNIAFGVPENVFITDNFEILVNKTSDIVSSVKICPCRKDIIFVMDYSGSIKVHHFERMQNAVSKIVNDFKFENVGQETIRVGVVVYGRGAVVEHSLQETVNVSTVIAKINSIERLSEYDRTWTSNALNVAADMFATEGRPNVTHCIVLFTDGRSHDQRKLNKTLTRLENQDASVLRVVGIGNRIDTSQLEEIAGDPDKVIMEPTFDDLDDAVEKIEAALVCF